MQKNFDSGTAVGGSVALIIVDVSINLITARNPKFPVIIFYRCIYCKRFIVQWTSSEKGKGGVEAVVTGVLKTGSVGLSDRAYLSKLLENKNTTPLRVNPEVLHSFKKPKIKSGSKMATGSGNDKTNHSEVARGGTFHVSPV